MNSLTTHLQITLPKQNFYIETTTTKTIHVVSGPKEKEKKKKALNFFNDSNCLKKKEDRERAKVFPHPPLGHARDKTFSADRSRQLDWAFLYRPGPLINC